MSLFILPRVKHPLAMSTFVSAFALSLVGPVSAQDAVFPEEAMDDLMRVTMAQTADEKCDGMSVRKLRLQTAMVKMLGTVKELGADPVAAVKYLETEEAAVRIAERSVALREKHEVDPEGDEALCEAIRAEANEDKDLARLMKIR